MTVAANLMLKLGAGVPQAERILFGALGWKSVAGLALFGCGGLLYAILLRRVPLNLAQVFASAQYVGVVAAAVWCWASRSRRRAGWVSPVSPGDLLGRLERACLRAALTPWRIRAANAPLIRETPVDDARSAAA